MKKRRKRGEDKEEEKGTEGGGRRDRKESTRDEDDRGVRGRQEGGAVKGGVATLPHRYERIEAKAGGAAHAASKEPPGGVLAPHLRAPPFSGSAAHRFPQRRRQRLC